jgi:hypothetical protein
MTPVLLTVFFYYGRDGFYRDVLAERVELWLGPSEYLALLPYAYWAVAAVVIRVAIPLLAIVWLVGDAPADYGYRLRGAGSHAGVYVLLLAIALPFVLLASSRPSFQETYPFYRGAISGGWHFWGYETLYLLQFVSIEAFFRGFLLFGLAPRFGNAAILVMTIPYCMIHFGKPAPEALGAIAAGIVLGVLALRCRSFVPGIFLHCAVALAMDVLAVYF